MCGFVGAFDLSTGSQPIDDGLKEELRKQVLEQSKTIRHRGPDWSGVYTGDNAEITMDNATTLYWNRPEEQRFGDFPQNSHEDLCSDFGQGES